MYRFWCWFCWMVCNWWWPFGFGRLAKPVYWWLLPFSGDYVLMSTE
jgi:hypothetical protein